MAGHAPIMANVEGFAPNICDLRGRHPDISARAERRADKAMHTYAKYAARVLDAYAVGGLLETKRFITLAIDSEIIDRTRQLTPQLEAHEISQIIGTQTLRGFRLLGHPDKLDLVMDPVIDGWIAPGLSEVEQFLAKKQLPSGTEINVFESRLWLPPEARAA